MIIIPRVIGVATPILYVPLITTYIEAIKETITIKVRTNL
jgi:hypothetical protein